MATSVSRNMPPDMIRRSEGGGWMLLALLGLLISLAILAGGFVLLRDVQTQQSTSVSPIVTAGLAIVWAVGGLLLLFITLYQVVERLPKPWPARLEPWVFVGPALVMLIWTLALPALRTFILSLQDANSVN